MKNMNLNKKNMKISLFLTLLVLTVQVSQSFGQVSPLINATWNQGCYYNDSCPVAPAGPCGNVYTGCAATALGQVMKFYEHPVNGWGSYSYTDPFYGLQSADFSTANYNWSSMPNSLSTSNTEVAKLLYHLGVSVDMDYGTTVSNSFFKNPLERYFKYSPKSHTEIKGSMSNTEWEDMLKTELDNGRVVYVKGGNHYYVIDGYQLSPIKFHCNFGWGGLYNGFYNIHNIVAGGNNYTPSVALIGIEPLTEIEVSVDTVYVPYSGGTAIYEFSSLTNWTCTSSQSWCTPALISGVDGFYDNSTGANCNVLANPTYSTRYANVTYNDGTVSKTVVIAQYPIIAFLSVSGSISESAGGGTQPGSIYTDSIWTATPDQSWISIIPNSGTGNTSINITIEPNPTSSTRNGNVIVNRGPFQELIPVIQTGVGASWCMPAMTTPNGNGVDNVTLNTINRTSAIDEGYILTIDTTELYLDSTYTISVSMIGSNAPSVWIDWNQDGDFNDVGEDVVPPSSTWYPTFTAVKTMPITVPTTAVEGLTRMRVFVKSFGTGPATDPCSTTSAGGDIEDYHIVVKNPHYLDIIPLSLNYTSIGGLQSVTIDSDSSWVASTGNSWLSLSVSSGTGVGTTDVTADPTSLTTSRIGSIIFTRGSIIKTVSVIQEGEDTLIQVTPASLSFSSSGGISDFDIISNTDYTITSTETWLTVGSSVGSGNATIGFNYTNNPLSSSRNAMVVVSSGTYADTLFVTQDGISALTVSPLTILFPWDGGSSQYFDIITTSGWSLSTSDTWLSTDVVSGSGNTTVYVTVDTNYTSTSRYASITITNGLNAEIVNITQDSSTTTGIEYNESDFSWSIFPNPSNDIIKIQIENSLTNYDVSVIDILGNTILRMNNPREINISSFSEGVYLLRINYNGQIAQKKILKIE